jgi:hypothetical protein
MLKMFKQTMQLEKNFPPMQVECILGDSRVANAVYSISPSSLLTNEAEFACRRSRSTIIVFPENRGFSLWGTKRGIWQQQLVKMMDIVSGGGDLFFLS